MPLTKIHVTANTHVTLNAQGTVAVDAAVSVPSVTQGGQSVELCIGSGSNFNAVTGFLVESPGTIYVKPVSAIGLQTICQTQWQGAGTFYDVAGEFNHRLPDAR